MKKNLVTKILVALLAATTTFGLVGCNVTTTQTYTESHTDADGNTVTTTTTTTTDENGTTTETTTSDEPLEDEEVDEEVEYINASLTIENESNFDFAELYFTAEADDDWGEDILGDDAPLAVGEKITFDDAITYAPGVGFNCDLRAVDADGNSLDFNGLDVSQPEDAESIYLLIEYDEEADSYSITAL